MDSTLSTILTVIGSIIGGGSLKVLFDYLVARSSQQSAHELAKQEFDNKAADGLIVRLEKRIAELESQSDKDSEALKLWATQVEKDRNDCRKEHAEAMHKIGELSGRVMELSKQVCPFPAAHTQTQPAIAQQTAG